MSSNVYTTPGETVPVNPKGGWVFITRNGTRVKVDYLTGEVVFANPAPDETSGRMRLVGLATPVVVGSPLTVITTVPGTESRVGSITTSPIVSATYHRSL